MHGLVRVYFDESTGIVERLDESCRLEDSQAVLDDSKVVAPRKNVRFRRSCATTTNRIS